MIFFEHSCRHLQVSVVKRIEGTGIETYMHHLQDSGGETGIRTLGPHKRTTVFETAPFDHSGISPYNLCKSSKKK